MQNDHATIRSCPFPIPVRVTDRHHYPATRGRDNSLLIINHVQYSLFNHHGPCSPSLLWHGVKLGNLRPLSRAALLALHPEPPAPARFGLVNARSIVNTSFIRKDFFKSQELDFLFVSETWLTVGESSAFTELVPGGVILNSPPTFGRGGGTTTMFLRVTLNVNKYRRHPPSPVLNRVCLNLGALTQCCVLWFIGLLNITETF